MIKIRNFWIRIRDEPALLTGAIIAIVNVFAAAQVWQPTEQLLAAINTALAAVLALFMHGSMPPAKNNSIPDYKRVRRPRSRARPENNDDLGPPGTIDKEVDCPDPGDWSSEYL